MSFQVRIEANESELASAILLPLPSVKYATRKHQHDSTPGSYLPGPSRNVGEGSLCLSTLSSWTVQLRLGERKDR